MHKFLVHLIICLMAVSGSAVANCFSVQNGNADNTVTNGTGNLMWSQCLLGQTGAQCKSGRTSELNWVNALNQVRGSELAGFKNWRLPKIEELELVLANCAEQGKAFAGLDKGFIWSASANLDFATEAWAINIATGKREVLRRHEAVYVLLVRDVLNSG
jgi:hypothetical protein